ncbi:hypothetical protein Hanom_Chr01g00025991 [Helianthus anomalus]
MSLHPTPDRGHLVRIPSILAAILFGTPDKEGIKESFERRRLECLNNLSGRTQHKKENQYARKQKRSLL